MYTKRIFTIFTIAVCAMVAFIAFYSFFNSLHFGIADHRKEQLASGSFHDENRVVSLKNLLTWIRQLDAQLKSRRKSVSEFNRMSLNVTNNTFSFRNIYTEKNLRLKEYINWLERIISEEQRKNATSKGSRKYDSIKTKERIVGPEQKKIKTFHTETVTLLRSIALQKNSDGFPVIPILVLACDRPTVQRCLHQLLIYRPSSVHFPIVVSRDCNDKNTTAAIAAYGNHVVSVRQPDQSGINVPINEEHLRGYYYVARHYRWLLNLVFVTVGFEAAVIVEDDIDVAPDFFEYFSAARGLMERDQSLWCASAWNDNGKRQLVDDRGSALIHRSDFFPGLGWMLTRSTWLSLAPGWPAAFWDDWMRRPEQRQGRACLRPEISRTRIFGAYGVSRGRYYDQYISRVLLSDHFVPFTQLDLNYLLKDRFDVQFDRTVNNSIVTTIEDLMDRNVESSNSVRILYKSEEDFKRAAQVFGLMDDVKSGVPRTAYRGVVTFIYRKLRVYLAPGYDWHGYDSKWT